MPRKWEPYSNDKAYLKLSTDLLSPDRNAAIDRGIRDEMYKFWFEDTNRNKYCDPTNPDATREYKSANPGMQVCFELLENSTEYNYLNEMFLLEYEKCMHATENVSAAARGFYNTFCLDMIGIRRLLIEYNLCCVKHAGRANSTLCGIKNFNKMFLDHDIGKLIKIPAPGLTSTVIPTTKVKSAADAKTTEAASSTQHSVMPLIMYAIIVRLSTYFY